jgi:hypothetical protein
MVPRFPLCALILFMLIVGVNSQQEQEQSNTEQPQESLLRFAAASMEREGPCCGSLLACLCAAFASLASRGLCLVARMPRAPPETEGTAGAVPAAVPTESPEDSAMEGIPALADPEENASEDTIMEAVPAVVAPELSVPEIEPPVPPPEGRPPGLTLSPQDWIGSASVARATFGSLDTPDLDTEDVTRALQASALSRDSAEYRRLVPVEPAEGDAVKRARGHGDLEPARLVLTREQCVLVAYTR